MILSLLLQFTVSFAQPETLRVERDVSNDVIYEIESKASRIARTARYSRATDANLAQALQLLENAELLLSGRNRSRLPEFKCTSRDSDNAAPYVFAFKDENYNVKMHRNLSYGSLQQCELSLNDANYFRDQSGNEFIAICGPRDGDNGAPWTAGILDANDGAYIKSLTFASYQNCARSMSAQPDRYGKVTFCTARDGDNSAPYIIGVFDPSTRTLTKLNQTFSDMNECERFRQ